MSEQAQDMTQPLVKRRGILAAAGAALAGLLAKSAADHVRAAPITGGTDGNPLIIGGGGGGCSCSPNTTAFGTSLISSNGGFPAFVGSNTGSGGIGLRGETTNGSGVVGIAQTGIGVFGTASTSSGFGVYGYNSATGGIGHVGYAPGGIGVYGVTNVANQYGVLGTTTAANSTAIAGIANQSGSSAFSGGTTNPAAYAGVFQGNVVIQGRLVVSDPSYKSGALHHPDGSTRLVYCVESPESWIEDVGKGQLVGGKATVTFDKDFAAVTHTDDYRVFLTAHGDSKGLYVTNETADGFEVREQQSGTSTLAFSWKVMVKARSGVKSERLGKFAMPTLPLPQALMVLEPPAATAPR